MTQRHEQYLTQGDFSKNPPWGQAKTVSPVSQNPFTAFMMM